MADGGRHLGRVGQTEVASDLEAGTAVKTGPAEAAFRRMSAVSLVPAPEGDPLNVFMTIVSPLICLPHHIIPFP